MSSIISSIISSTVGLLLNKGRDKTAEKLKDGDVTDAKIREIVVRELNDIKTKLDGLSRKDLLCSYSFLREGIHILYDSLEKSCPAKQEDQTEVNKTAEANIRSVVTTSDDSRSAILTEAQKLTKAFVKVKIEGNSQFETAKKRFEHARIKATEAFSNESLKVEDRIFAAKLRVVSEILEYLECPETSITSCFLFLQDLHDLHAVREIFTVYMGRGPRSYFNKSERVENVRSVMLINYVLFQFIRQVRQTYDHVNNWPTIELTDDRTFRPIWDWREISDRDSLGDDLLQAPNEVKFELPYGLPFVLNYRGEMVWCDNKNVKVTTKDVTKVVGTFLDTAVTLTCAIDEHGNLYVLRESYRQGCYIQMFDKNFIAGDKTDITLFPVQTANVDVYFEMVVVNENLVICCRMVNLRAVDFVWSACVFICDCSGILKHQFTPAEYENCEREFSLCVSNKNEIFLSKWWINKLYIYSMEGLLISTKELKHDIEILDMTFHFGRHELLMVARRPNGVVCCDVSGENIVKLNSFDCIKSFPGGVAVIYNHRSRVLKFL